MGEKSLSKIASALDKPMVTDECTSKKLRVSYARIMVEIDITQPLKQFVKIRDKEGNVIQQAVEYEWKPSFCQICQKVGHVCPPPNNAPPNPNRPGNQRQQGQQGQRRKVQTGKQQVTRWEKRSDIAATNTSKGADAVQANIPSTSAQSQEWTTVGRKNASANKNQASQSFC